MSLFQVVSIGALAVVAVLAYRKDFAFAVKRFVARKQQAALDVKPSIAVTIVDDLLSVTELRDKLAAEDCAEGVEACTSLLRVIVEQTKPTKTAG
jgi:hypothetical protein